MPCPTNILLCKFVLRSEIAEVPFILKGSRRTNYKNLMKDCLSILCGLCQAHTGLISNHGCSENSVRKPSGEHNTPLVFALLEVGKSTCIAMQRFLILVSYRYSFKFNITHFHLWL